MRREAKAVLTQARHDVICVADVEGIVAATKNVHPRHSTTLPSSRQTLQSGGVEALRLATLAQGTTRFGLPRGRLRREAKPNRVVRKGGFEPPRYCYRQPLKLVRLPVPPLPQVVRITTSALPQASEFREQAPGA